MRRRTRALCALLLCAVLPLAGCASRRGSLAAGHANELRVALAQEPASLDPLLLEGPIAYAVSELLYSYLTNYDSEGSMVPDLALQVPTPENGGVSADGKRVTFHLRRGVRWQDGAALTSRDVLFTYRAIMNPANSLPERFGYDKIAAISAPDPYTVVIRLRRAYAPIVPLFFGGDSNYPILPAHVLAKYTSLNNVPFNERPIGSGPYALASWVRGDRLVLDANPRYYRGKPPVQRLVLPFVHDPSTIVNELQTGELDAAFSLDAARISQLRALPAHRVIVTPIPYFYAISFNLSDPVLREANVRRALALAIDRESIVRKISHGVYDPQTGLRGLFTWAYDPGADRLPYDPRLARELLHGRRLQLQLAFPAGSQITAQLATAIAQAESAIGVDVTLKRYAREVYMANDGPIMQGRYQLQLYDFHSNYDPDAAWLLACDQQSPTGFNHAHYCDAAVDRALQSASSVYERGARSRLYASVQTAVARDLPYFFLCQASDIDVIPTVLEHYDRPLLSSFNSVARWSLRGRKGPG
ncbi:MAG TPA: peptide ABC transporter substrate-binding protein [Candidatus Baltobacteraceae bacterium]|nr:peptide ABC transporter substrate-binding protein [Candidatus Baltobacteraceae bacterium]